MMFGRNLKRREVSRGLVDVFGGCSVGIGRLGKKMSKNFGESEEIPSSYQVNQIMYKHINGPS
jgi:hypothetical protein